VQRRQIKVGRCFGAVFKLEAVPQVMGFLLTDTNRLADAELLYRRVLAICEKSVGLDHPEVVIGEAEHRLRRSDNCETSRFDVA
jgi:hypothetical protein